MVHVGLVQLFLQLLRRADGFDLAVDHDGKTVAILGLVHIVGGHEYGDAFGGGFVDEVPELAAGGGIDTTSGLVEEDDTRLVEDTYRLWSAKANCSSTSSVFRAMVLSSMS